MVSLLYYTNEENSVAYWEVIPHAYWEITTELHQQDVGTMQASPPKSDELNWAFALNFNK